MKPHPKLRKAIKWGGAVVTVLLVVVWIGSGWYHRVRESWTTLQTTGFVSLTLLAAIWMVAGAHGVLTGQGVGRWPDGQEMTPSDALVQNVFPLAISALALSYLLYSFFTGR